jgi:hypothetical protein
MVRFKVVGSMEQGKVIQLACSRALTSRFAIPPTALNSTRVEFQTGVPFPSRLSLEDGGLGHYGLG